MIIIGWRSSRLRGKHLLQLHYSASQSRAFACGSMVLIDSFVCGFSALRTKNRTP
jgi:hypothetical protein